MTATIHQKTGQPPVPCGREKKGAKTPLSGTAAMHYPADVQCQFVLHFDKGMDAARGSTRIEKATFLTDSVVARENFQDLWYASVLRKSIHGETSQPLHQLHPFSGSCLLKTTAPLS